MKNIVFGSIPEESTDPQEDHDVMSSQAMRKKSEVFVAKSDKTNIILAAIAIVSLLTIMILLFVHGPSAYVKGKCFQFIDFRNVSHFNILFLHCPNLENSVQFTENQYLVMKGDNFLEVKLVKVPDFYGSFEVELKSNQENLIEDDNQIIHFEGGELTKTLKIQTSNATNNFKIHLKDPTNDITLGEKPVIDISLVGKFYKILQFSPIHHTFSIQIVALNFKLKYSMNITTKVIFLESMSCNMDFPINKDIGLQTMKMQFGTTLSTAIGKFLEFKILEQPIHIFMQILMIQC